VQIIVALAAIETVAESMSYYFISIE